MKIETTVRYPTTRHHQKSLQIINTEEDVEKKELSYTVSRNVNWFSHWRTVWRVLKKTKNRVTI